MRKALSFLLIVAIAMPIMLSHSFAADYKIVKQVIGNGGMVGAVSGDVKMSGTFGQSIIEKREGQAGSSGRQVNVYQGFWNPIEDPTDVDDPSISLNANLTNYPNPVSEFTTFKYTLESNSVVRLVVYDMVGNRVAVAFEGFQAAGEQKINWSVKNNNGLDIVAGSYIYELQVNPSDAAGPGAFEPFSLRNVMVIVK